MKVLLILFIGMASLLWVTVFGYFFLLEWIASRRGHREQAKNPLPDIALVVPVLNEERLILAKLDDIRRTDYPHEKITILIVDGGSSDHTRELVKQAALSDNRISFICLDHPQGKADQVVHALNILPHEFIVVTDADSQLEPSCVRELVTMLERDPQTAAVGAVVEPATRLAEERIHWWFLNHIWWLEGEALSAAHLSGVCYACRRSLMLLLSRNARAEDIQLALATGALGFRVRICSTAQAVELRVPQTLKEIFQFRRRRGSAYLSELLHSSKTNLSSGGWRLARFMRLWHFLGVPKIAVILVAAGCVLLGTKNWPWPVLSFSVFLLPMLAVLFFSSVLKGEKYRLGRLTLATGRLLIFTLASLLTLSSHPQGQSPVGGGS